MRALHSTAAIRAPDMFCMQCEQTEKGTGCTVVGVCGKTPTVAGLQDLLVDNIKGLSMWLHRARQLGVPEDATANRFIMDSLFATLTNVNFDERHFQTVLIPEAIALRDQARARYVKACQDKGVVADSLVDTPATWKLESGDLSWLLEESKHRGVLAHKDEYGEQASSLQEMIVYGIKGLAAYASHARAVQMEDNKVYAAVQQILSDMATKDEGKLLGLALKVGEANMRVLELLDNGHTARFGNPTPATVRTTPIPGKAILVSGHDLHDLEQLLQQTEGTGINVYTHGEMLPAHGYPGLRKYKHLAGNYGGAWNLQKFEFAKFPGPIVMTTNCLIEPRKSYKDRIYTCNAVGWPDVTHITGHNKDFSNVIKQAQSMEGFVKDKNYKGPEQTVMVGFGHHTILALADKVLGAVKEGHLKHIFVIGGCDGNENERNYYRDLAVSSPPSSVILTLGCGKYRFNKLEFGNVPNTPLPRVLDMGQCNDAYGAVVVASALAKALNTDVNGLPISFAISWFEQKAVAVLLTLLNLGVKNIALGPNLPASVTPKTAKFLSDNLGLRRADVDHVEDDLQKFLTAKH